MYKIIKYKFLVMQKEIHLSGWLVLNLVMMDMVMKVIGQKVVTS